MDLTNRIQKLNRSDVEICKAFKTIVSKGKFEIQGEALMKVGAIFKWFEELDKRIEETIKQPPPETIRKELVEEKKERPRRVK